MVFVRHLIPALVISFGLSLAFWALFGVFAAVPFVVVSTLCALAGAAAGAVLGNHLWITIVATVIVRLAAYGAAGGTFVLS